MILFILKFPIPIIIISMIIDCLFHDLINVFRHDSIENYNRNQLKFPLSSQFAGSTSTILHINEPSNSDFMSMPELDNHDHNATKYSNKEINDLNKFLEEMNRKFYKTKIRKITMKYQNKILKELNSCR